MIDTDPKTWRELLAGLRAIGAEPTRRRGSHETWRTPSGATYTAVVHRLAARPSRALVNHFKKLVEAEVRRAA